MTQYVIDIGAVANDGTGDPLRTAFNDTNLNFDQVFAAGPVLSNVQIANNKILTLNTNGNLILAPNGTGIVQSNVSIVPNLANLRDLGSSTQRWRTVYTQYLDVSANLNITGNIIYNGDLTVAGNLTVQGNIIQVGNIVTETLTIQLANAASTANAANGSGITVGANDDIATLLYNSTGNVWTTNIGISSVGNITAPYFFGNGSQLTGLAATYGNANVVTLLAGFGSNTVSTTGNITGGYLFGNGSQLTGLGATYSNANVVTLLAGFGSNIVSTSGNITGGYLFGNGSQLTGLPATYGNANVVANLAALGSNPISTTGNISSGNILTGGLISATGNVIAGNLSSPTLNNSGNISVVASGNTWTFNDTGSTIFPTLTTQRGDNPSGTIQGQTLLFGDATQEAIISTADGTVSNENSQRLVINPGQGYDYGEGGDIYLWAGRGGDGSGTGGDIKIRGGQGGANTVGGAGGAGGYIRMEAGDAVGDGQAGYVQITGGYGNAQGGNVSISGGYGTALGGNVLINSGGYTWTVGTYGKITLPFGATLKDTSGDSVAFGQNAGANNQSQHSVAIGPEAGMNNQGEDSVAIGWLAGRDDQTSFSIAIGWNAGSNTQGQLAQAYGRNAGAYYQKNSAIAMGYDAARYLQGQSAIAIGSNAGYGGPQGTTVASMPSPDVVRVFGSTSTLYNGMTAVGGSIAPTTGITIVGLSGEDITLSSVPAEPLTNGTTLYFYPAQGSGAVAIGSGSAQALQGQNAVAVGYRAGQTRQGNSSVSIGEDAGYTTQGANAISIGSAAGSDTQGATAISIGLNAGRTTQGQASIAMGFSAGFTGQGNSSVALGEEAGYTTQGQNSIAIGRSAGQSSQGNSAIAMGWTAAQTTQGNAAIAIGEDAGRYYQGEYSIAIGRTAGFNLQANNSIILNATGLHVNATTANSFIVQPIRNAAAGNVLYYDEFTGEITFDVGGSGGLPVANGTSNFDIATANGNATITANSASTWTFGTDSALTLPASSGQIGRSGYPNGIDLYNNNGGTGYVRMNYADESLISADSGGAHVQTTGGTWDFDTTGNLTAPGNVSAVGNIIGGNIVTSGSGGDITLTSGNITGAGNISATGNVTAANFFGNVSASGNIIVGNISATGNITANYFIGNLATPTYGSFYDTTTQINSNVGNAIAISYNTTDINNGVTIAGAGNTQITIAETGIYNIQFSLQVLKTDPGSDTVYVWLDKNGNRVANTGTGLYLVGDNAAEVAAWNFVVSATANDYYRLMWMSADSHVELLATAAGAVVPAIPSVILTVVPVGA